MGDHPKVHVGTAALGCPPGAARPLLLCHPERPKSVILSEAWSSERRSCAVEGSLPLNSSQPR